MVIFLRGSHLSFVQLFLPQVSGQISVLVIHMIGVKEISSLGKTTWCTAVLSSCNAKTFAACHCYAGVSRVCDETVKLKWN